MNIIWLIIGCLAVLFVLPCLIWAGVHSKKVARELCGHCIYHGAMGKHSPCRDCVDCDRFEGVNGHG